MWKGEKSNRVRRGIPGVAAAPGCSNRAGTDGLQGISGACPSCWGGDEVEALSPGLQWGFICTASRSAPKGELHLPITGCLEGKGLAGSVFTEGSPVLYRHREWGTTWGYQPHQSEVGERGSSPHLLSLCPGRDAKAGWGGSLLPTQKDVWLFLFFPHRHPLLDRPLPPLPTNFISAASLVRHSRSITAAASVRYL